MGKPICRATIPWAGTYTDTIGEKEAAHQHSLLFLEGRHNVLL